MKNRCDVSIIMVLERKNIISFRWIYIDVHYGAATRIVIRLSQWMISSSRLDPYNESAVLLYLLFGIIQIYSTF